MTAPLAARLALWHQLQWGLGALSPGTQTVAQYAAQGFALSGAIVAGLVAIPLIGPIAAGLAALGMVLANVFSGCGSTCTEATSLANQAEPLLDQNLTQYMSSPIHYYSLQQAALNNFLTTWGALTQACGNPQLGAAGQRCITDRQQGACTIKAATAGGWSQDSAGTWSYTGYGPSVSSGGVCWNWWVGYHDPIANDPTVVPDPSPANVSAASSSGVLSSSAAYSPAASVLGSSVPSGVLLAGGALALYLLLR